MALGLLDLPARQPPHHRRRTLRTRTLASRARAAAIEPAWKTKASWFLLAEEDRVINPETQHFMAERMGAKIRFCSVDHTPLVTAPDQVVDVILEAVAASTA
jgi:pimeloyl-ACP methyl ester carboxylesterase